MNGHQGPGATPVEGSPGPSSGRSFKCPPWALNLAASGFSSRAPIVATMAMGVTSRHDGWFSMGKPRRTRDIRVATGTPQTSASSKEVGRRPAGLPQKSAGGKRLADSCSKQPLDRTPRNLCNKQVNAIRGWGPGSASLLGAGISMPGHGALSLSLSEKMKAIPWRQWATRTLAMRHMGPVGSWPSIAQVVPGGPGA